MWGAAVGGSEEPYSNAASLAKVARQALLGYCLEEHVAPDWEADLFVYDEKVVFLAIREMAATGRPIDWASVAQFLMGKGEINGRDNPTGKVHMGFFADCMSRWEDSHQIVPHLLEQAARPLDEVNRARPMIDQAFPVSQIAGEIGDRLKTEPIFLRADAVVTVDEATGRLRTMTADRFCSWVEDFVAPFRRNRAGEEVVRSIGKDLAGKILTSDQFRSAIRPLVDVNPVRLPVTRADGSVELLQQGYDDATGTWTHEGLSYDEDLPVDEALGWISALLGSWPWNEPGGVGVARSSSVQFAAMVGVFCRQMFPPGTPRPMLCEFGNQPGTGKSTLVAMALSPVFGACSTSDLPTSKEELRKALDSAAEAYLPFLWFDDIGGGIFSNALNRFITASSHSGRHLGSSERFEVPNVCQVFATGNGIRLTPDLARRSLVVELFVAGSVAGRHFDQTISPAWLASDEVRAKTLAALWSAVRAWNENGRPAGTSPPMESFELWSAIVAGIVQDFGFGDPLERPELSLGGDEEGDEFRLLFTALADEMAEEGETERDFRRADLVEKAREMGLLEDLVGSTGEPDLKADQNKTFGRRLGKWKGREFPTTTGGTFEFGSRHDRRGTVYHCSITARQA